MREGIGSLSSICKRGRNKKRAEDTLVPTCLPIIYPWHLSLHLLQESALKCTELKESRGEVVSPCCRVKQPGGHCPFPSAIRKMMSGFTAAQGLGGRKVFACYLFNKWSWEKSPLIWLSSGRGTRSGDVFLWSRNISGFPLEKEISTGSSQFAASLSK